MKKILASIAAISLLLTPFSGYSYESGDWQYWNTESIGGKLIDVGTEKLDSLNAKIEGEWRFGDDVSELCYQHVDVGLSFEKLFVPWFTLGLNYRQAWEKKSDGWLEEEKPHINGTISFKLADWKISNRSRIEYRHFNSQEDKWRFRNKTTAKAPVKWTAWEITPYLADEIFLEEGKDGIYRNRLYVGLGIGHLFKLEHLKGDVFYLWQATESSDDWISYNVFGTKLKVVF